MATAIEILNSTIDSIKVTPNTVGSISGTTETNVQRVYAKSFNDLITALEAGLLTLQTNGGGLKNNFIATTVPGVSNDGTQGYSIGSLWFNTITGFLYIATSVGTGTATWEAVANGSGGLALSAYDSFLGAAKPFASATSGTTTAGLNELVPTGNFAQLTLNNPTNVTFIEGYNAGTNAAAITAAQNLYTALQAATPLTTTNYGTDIAANNLETVTVGGGPAGTFTPGIYYSSVSLTTAASQTITLNGDGDYVFKTSGTMGFGASTLMILTNGARASRVFWASAGAITGTGLSSVLKGTFVTALAATTGASNNIEGRILTTAGGAFVIGASNVLRLPTTV